MDHQAATAPGPQRLPAEWEAFRWVTVTVPTTHVNTPGLRLVCSCAWPSERGMTEQNLAAL